MNGDLFIHETKPIKPDSFRPQQGLIIMNYVMLLITVSGRFYGFRPQQGLIIMNFVIGMTNTIVMIVSVPNRG